MIKPIIDEFTRYYDIKFKHSEVVDLHPTVLRPTPTDILEAARDVRLAFAHSAVADRQINGRPLLLIRAIEPNEPNVVLMKAMDGKYLDITNATPVELKSIVGPVPTSAKSAPARQSGMLSAIFGLSGVADGSLL